MANKTGTIWQRVEKKLDNLEEKALKKALRIVRRERFMESARAMTFWEKLELHIKIGI